MFSYKAKRNCIIAFLIEIMLIKSPKLGKEGQYEQLGGYV